LYQDVTTNFLLFRPCKGPFTGTCGEAGSFAANTSAKVSAASESNQVRPLPLSAAILAAKNFTLNARFGQPGTLARPFYFWEPFFGPNPPAGRGGNVQSRAGRGGGNRKNIQEGWFWYV
jgi:hypothetical protein